MDLVQRFEYGRSASPNLAVMVTGFRGKQDQVMRAVGEFCTNGYGVVSYDFAEDVFTAGQPELLTQAVQEVTDDVTDRVHTDDVQTVLPTGVSTGALFTLELQRQKIATLPGVYGAAGADSAQSIFHNPALGFLRKAYQQRGYGQKDLTEQWAELHRPPEDGFVVALGVLDYIVHYPGMLRRIAQWRRQGVPVAQRPVMASHTGTINWFNIHVPELMEMHAVLGHVKAPSDRG